MIKEYFKTKTNMPYKFILIIFFGIGLESCNSQVLNKENYQEDLKQLVNTLMETHPQPFEFINKDEFQDLVDEQNELITDSTDIMDFNWMARKIIAKIGCGHTYIYDVNNKTHIPDSLYIPLQTQFLNSKLYVKDPFNNAEKVKAGTEILKINGMPVEQIQQKIFEIISADGYNKSAKWNYINRYFPRLLALLLDTPKDYSVTIEKANKEEEISLNKITTGSSSSTNFLLDCKKRLCFEINEEKKIGILTIRSFSFGGGDLNAFKRFIDDSFEEIKTKKIENLIIDVRDNGGGDPYCASYLLQQIAHNPFNYFQKSVGGYGDIKENVVPLKLPFLNKPYVLIDGRGFSTTGHFCSLVKHYDLGIFVGQELGSTYTCNDNSETITLKNTQLAFRVARNTYATIANQFPKNKGILVDYEVLPTVTEMIHNEDVVMKYTLRLIQ